MIQSPAFPTIGGPVVEAVPTGISTYAGQLLVTLFRGFPFPAGTSSVQLIKPADGSRTAALDGFKAAIDALVVRSATAKGSLDLLVLQHASSPVLFTEPGTLVRVPKLGIGKIISVTDDKADVAFPSGDRRTIKTAFLTKQ